MSLVFIYPANYFSPALPDAHFQAEAQALKRQGLEIVVWSGGQEMPGLQFPRHCLYRGWMLASEAYQQGYALWAKAGLLGVTRPEQYALCHYLPHWYHLLADWTPETIRINHPEELSAKLEALDWGTYFLKDDVKSLKAGQGSRVSHPQEARRWLQEMHHYQGGIQGGICIRRWEDWQPNSEIRWFVWQGQAYGPERELAAPEPVLIASERIDSPFFSVDIVRDVMGRWRIVELDDGQVSDLSGWRPERFAELFCS